MCSLPFMHVYFITQLFLIWVDLYLTISLYNDVFQYNDEISLNRSFIEYLIEMYSKGEKILQQQCVTQNYISWLLQSYLLRIKTNFASPKFSSKRNFAYFFVNSINKGFIKNITNRSKTLCHNYCFYAKWLGGEK